MVGYFLCTPRTNEINFRRETIEKNTMPTPAKGGE